ncbi:hypothetical protein [Acinetobacter sp. Ac_5812]|uniref:hypothetical protein n=1 Tax=Acinetobacter sp. Ac_5812 TaxID=1848937 RepID=UPI00148FADDE|nr:hypothetical protein [Acinetobacter sp. Ac_5812]NNP70423.1 hypothetical protein [Acinetobacter sp. Ac_5812]
MTPAKIKKRIDAFQKQYEEELRNLAEEVLQNRIIPYCKEHKLSFVMMNGVPRLVNQSNEYVVLPKFMRNLFEVTDDHGDHLMYWMNDFKFSDTTDFNEADEKHHKKAYTDRSLASLVFSPAFALLR